MSTWHFIDSEGFEDYSLNKKEVQELCELYMKEGCDFVAELIYEEQEEPLDSYDW